MRVLIVDDNETDRKLLRAMLSGGGHETVEASDGVEALDRLRSERLDVVISDILMPRMDGYRFCYEIRRDEKLREIPILIYSTTYTSPADEQLALGVGADRFLRRPSAPSEILRALEEMARGSRPPSEAVPFDSELEVQKEYSERLVRQLESRTMVLEAAKERLELSERHLRDLVDRAPIGIYRSTREGRIVSVNAALVRLLGYESPEEVLQLDIARDVYFDSAEREHLIAANAPLGLIVGFEVRFKRKDGSPVWVRLDSRAVRGNGDQIEGFEGFVHDISEGKRAEEALRNSEQRFSSAFHASPIPTVISEIKTGHILDVNEQFLRVLGYSREQVIGKTSLELGIFVDRGDWARAQARVRVDGAIHDQVTPIRARSGEIREVVGSVVPIDLSGVKCALWTCLDITERLQVERQIRERTTFLNALVEHSPLGILVLDADHRVQMANPAFVSLFGYSREDLQGNNPDDLIARGDDALRAEAEAFTRGSLTGDPVHAVTTRRRKDGALVEVELDGVPLLENGRVIGVYAIYQDLTERRRLEKQLIQAQKMEAVGQLAGGVAHDFNNLLTAILGYSELVAAKLAPESVEFGELDEVRKAGERAASLTRQLLAFSRQQVLERKVLDVNELIANVEKMLRRLIGEDVQLTTVLDPALRRVFVDAGQLEQVIMNLAVNARDAMPSGGKLTIETANVELDEAYARQHVTVRPGRYVMIAVSDTGIGMNDETRAHIFEPFFTTKGPGKGTGLGLAMVYGIVKQSGGYIWAYSEVGMGTSFKIYLPLIKEGAEAEPVPAAEPTALHGSETVLLVEDEQSVRRLSRSILEDHGYTVLEAASGKDGLDVARRYLLPIHLLLTDVVMPEMGGPDLAFRLKALRPGLRTLYMSGYTDDAVFRHGLLEKGSVFLQKPFTPKTLARKVREALGR